jgi:hypothetical protein
MFVDGRSTEHEIVNFVKCGEFVACGVYCSMVDKIR